MSAIETVCLWRYQGARARWAARSRAGWPWRRLWAELVGLGQVGSVSSTRRLYVALLIGEHTAGQG